MPSPRRHLSVDELSQRASTGLAIRRGEVKISDPIPTSYIHNGPEMDGAFEQPQPTPKLEGTAVSKHSGGFGSLRGKSDGLGQPAHISRFTERTSTGPALTTSSNMSSVGSKDLSLQRRSTGLRATLRRMFSSRRDNHTAQAKNTYGNGPVRTQSVGPHTLLNECQKTPLHRGAVSPSRALHSHAPSPHMRVESEGIIKTGPNIGRPSPRRNTVPSLLIVQTEERDTDTAPQEECTELGEPAASAPALEKEKVDRIGNDDEQYTQDRPRTANRPGTPPPIQFRRRSRSADALAELLRSSSTKAFEQRDRAEEIAYWRNSIVVDPLPPLPNPEKFKPMDVGSFGDRGAPRTPRHRAIRSIEPVQEFDFGLDDTKTSVRALSLQERVNTLEVKLVDFEYALAKLQGVDVNHPNLSDMPPQSGSLQSGLQDSARSSSLESPSVNDLSCSSTQSEFRFPNSPRDHLRADRASKATTIKPIHRRNSSSKSGSSSHASVRLTREQYDALRQLIEGEKSARQQLEVQVMNLHKEVQILKDPIYSYSRPTKYPTPSPDSFRETSTLTTPRLRNRSPPREPRPDPNEMSRFSMSETEPETEADESYTEEFETPQESHFAFESNAVTRHGMI